MFANSAIVVFGTLQANRASDLLGVQLFLQYAWHSINWDNVQCGFSVQPSTFSSKYLFVMLP